MVDFKNFHKVENLNFDISKLKKSLSEVLKIRSYDSANGIPNFAAICLNQIPGDPNSTKGNRARGVFWTKPKLFIRVEDRVMDKTKAKLAKGNQQEAAPNHISPAFGSAWGRFAPPIYGLGLFLVYFLSITGSVHNSIFHPDN